jgi:hypothetical protein
MCKRPQLKPHANESNEGGPPLIDLSYEVIHPCCIASICTPPPIQWRASSPWDSSRIAGRREAGAVSDAVHHEGRCARACGLCRPPHSDKRSLTRPAVQTRRAAPLRIAAPVSPVAIGHLFPHAHLALWHVEDSWPTFVSSQHCLLCPFRERRSHASHGTWLCSRAGGMNAPAMHTCVHGGEGLAPQGLARPSNACPSESMRLSGSKACPPKPSRLHPRHDPRPPGKAFLRGFVKKADSLAKLKPPGVLD